MTALKCVFVPRGRIVLELTKGEARKLLKALSGPSVTDPVLADIYRALSAMVEREG